MRRSTRARRIRVNVHPDARVEVVIPSRATQADAEAAVLELRAWIVARRTDALDAMARTAPAPGTVVYLGEVLRVVAEPGRTRVHRRGDRLLVPDVEAAAAIERWYRRRARAEIEPLLTAATAALGRPYTRLTVRNQRTRWGSCSADGALSFNWRLLLGPPEVLDYVVWHEACHLVHHDHSKRYWALVERHCPGYRGPQRWLRVNGAGLILPPL